MAKAEWGVKRTCLSCGARFYDLQRQAITCPACGAAVDVTAPSKPRRARATPVIVKAAVAPVLVEVEAAPVAPELEGDEEIVETEAADEEAEEEDGESAIEDVSELGDDDMADVIDTEIDEEETDR